MILGQFFQIVLVEPDSTRLGWGVATFVGFLQDLEVVTDKDDSRSVYLYLRSYNLEPVLLQITVQFSCNLQFGELCSKIHCFDSSMVNKFEIH